MFGRSKLLVKHRDRQEDAVGLLQVQDRKAAARKKEGWKKEIWEATV
jgi:hypothetical protein